MTPKKRNHLVMPILLGTVILFGTVSGCESFGEIKLPGMTTSAELNQEKKLAQEHREQFQINGSPEAIRWLKANRIQTGMSLQTVEQVIGNPGERVYDDDRYKARDDRYHIGDETYKWGPDSNGNSHLLVFRNNRIVNYNPKEFQAEAFR